MERRLANFGDLSPAEARLRDEIGLRAFVQIGTGDVPPENAGKDFQIRASFVRYLMLGGCDAMPMPVPATGVRLRGARITDQLFLEGEECLRELSLHACRIDQAPHLLTATLKGLYLDGSHVPGLFATRLSTIGGVHLRDTKVSGAVRLPNARIGAVLDCKNMELTSTSGANALDCDTADVSGGVSLNGAHVEGAVSVAFARIGGVLDCSNAKLSAGSGKIALNCNAMELVSGDAVFSHARFTGEVQLIGARIAGDLDCVGGVFSADDSRKGFALSASRSRVVGTVFLHYPTAVAATQFDGIVSFVDAELGSIWDNTASWPKTGTLRLNGCRYGSFIGEGTPVFAQDRIAWLDRQNGSTDGEAFEPQPWEQCAKVLREMGHGEEARKVLIAKEVRQRRARRAKAGWAKPLLWLSDWLMAVTTRYGRRPMLAVWWLLGFWALGVGIFHMAESSGAIKPNNAFILRSPEWAACAPDYLPARGGPPVRVNQKPYAHQLDCFRDQPEAASYPAFNRYTYSADTLLPIVAMEMQEYWLPDENAGGWGQVARVYLWVQIIAGWALSLLAVAGFSGLIKTDNTT